MSYWKAWVIRFGERTPGGQDDPTLQDFSDAPRTLVQITGDRVRLGELGVTAVEDHGLAAMELIVEER
jgi:hypothetical protein